MLNSIHGWRADSRSVWDTAREANGGLEVMLGPGCVLGYPLSCDFVESGQGVSRCVLTGFQGKSWNDYSGQ